MKAEHLWQDQGIQTLRLLLMPHVGNRQHSNMVRIAEEFMAPSIPIYQGIYRKNRLTSIVYFNSEFTIEKLREYQ